MGCTGAGSGGNTMTRDCFNCTYFQETIDDYWCWLSGKPVHTNIYDDCEGWEHEG